MVPGMIKNHDQIMKMDKSENYCQFLEWDTNFFGFRIARVSIDYLNQDIVDSIDCWCSKQKIDCLYFLCNPYKRISIKSAERNNFHFVDIRLTFEVNLDNISLIQDTDYEYSIRPVIQRDIPILKSIASTIYRETRFFSDNNFPEDLSSIMYEIWIEKSCDSYAESVFVAESNGELCGYITCNLDNQYGRIGLVGVSPKYSSRGIGKKLINRSFQWFIEKGVNKVHIVTQGRNVRAQRLYQRCGFISKTVQIWFHKWYR